jgi:ornithine--oxo-acid transaminase
MTNDERQRELGVHMWDVDGKQYYDFLSAYSAVNQVRENEYVV